MTEPVWLLPDLVRSVHRALLAEHGGAVGLRDAGLLDAALARPKQRLAYGEAHSVFDLAASYSYAIARNHPFVDGNKRVALTLGAVFLELNGYTLEAPEPQAVVMFRLLAAGDVDEAGLSAWFADHAVKHA